VRTEPLVSIVTTAYNRERYIGSAIESVLAQTFTDFELVVVDDGSTDRTAAVARSYEEDPRVRVIVNERNLGDYPNRNHAAGFARGRFLKYHDSDDLMYPHCLQIMLDLLAAHPSAAFALSSGWVWPGGPCPMLLTPRLCYQREFLGFGLFACGPSNALFRTATFRRLGGFPEMGTGSDYLFWLKACARESILLVPGDLFWYRVHPGQQLRGEEASRDYARLGRHVWRALHAPDCPLDPAEREQARKNVAYGTVKSIYWELKARRWKIAWLRWRSAGLSAGDWLRYLRRPRRDRMAGTPLDRAGEYLTPHWTTLGSRQTPEPTAPDLDRE
jgi:glycosyltransferase involved in cell wall biosynthesis